MVNVVAVVGGSVGIFRGFVWLVNFINRRTAPQSVVPAPQRNNGELVKAFERALRSVQRDSKDETGELMLNVAKNLSRLEKELATQRLEFRQEIDDIHRAMRQTRPAGTGH